MPADAIPHAVTPRATDASLRVAAPRLRAFVAAILHAAGVPIEASDVVATALVDADLAGLPSHGVMLVPMYVERLRAGSVTPAVEGRIASDRGSALVIDAGNALGQLTSRQAVRFLGERAPVHGLAAVAVRNAFHFGAAGYWASALAEHGSIGIAMSNTRPLMPAPGGGERVVGNNPLAIAMPGSDGSPLVFDMATSAGAMGKIRLAAASGAAIPSGWATDARGAPTTDAAAAIKGMLLPAGGAKGFGLALMIDLLCGGLSSGAIGDAVRPLYANAAEPYGCAHCFIAIDVARFRDLPGFAEATTAVAERIRASAAAPGVAHVAVPGDRAARARQTNGDDCPVSADTARELAGLASSAGIDSPFPTA